VIQQGQVFKLRATGAGRAASRRALARLGRNGGAVTITLGELVDEYLALHQAGPDEGGDPKNRGEVGTSPVPAKRR
jgi:hypothetical protein